MENTPTILSSDLQHGDVLLYTRRRHQGIFPRGIRFITGSRFTHAGIIQMMPNGQKIVMEQLGERSFDASFCYHMREGESVVAFRPKFPVVGFLYNSRLHSRNDYGYLGIVDCLINHLMGRLTRGRWQARAMLGKLTPNRIICSALVAQALNLTQTTNWCVDPLVVEPDDYANHRESFTELGTVVWVG